MTQRVRLDLKIGAGVLAATVVGFLAAPFIGFLLSSYFKWANAVIYGCGSWIDC